VPGGLASPLTRVELGVAAVIVGVDEGPVVVIPEGDVSEFAVKLGLGGRG
jgi:hypothetical protein